MFETPSLVELLRIGFMAPLDLPVHLRAAWWDVFVGHAEVGKVPSELWPERRAVIGLNFLNREREMLLDLTEEVVLFPLGERTSHPVGRNGPEPAEVHPVVLDRDISFAKQGQRDDDERSSE